MSPSNIETYIYLLQSDVYLNQKRGQGAISVRCPVDRKVTEEECLPLLWV